MAQTVATDL